jgi:hypothetical protein
MRKPLGISALLAVFGLLAYSILNLPSALADSNLIEDPGFETSLSPILIQGTSLDTGKEDFRHIIMPLKI